MKKAEKKQKDGQQKARSQDERKNCSLLKSSFM